MLVFYQWWLNTFTRGEIGMAIQGTTGNDRLYGTSGADKIVGDLGNDTILGYEGNDTIYGDKDYTFSKVATIRLMVARGTIIL